MIFHVYRHVVERKLRRAFAALNAGDPSQVLAAFAPDAEHTFFGEHALAGTRTDPASVKRWYARLGTLFPDLHFDLDSVLVRGLPWDTVAVVEWRDRFTLRDGQARGNQGVHVLRLRWERVISLRIHCDTQRLAGVLKDLQAQGVSDAGQAPIVSAIRP